MFQFFLWILYILINVRTIWHIKTLYSSNCLNTLKSKNIPGGENVLIPLYCILLVSTLMQIANNVTCEVIQMLKDFFWGSMNICFLYLTYSKLRR